MTSRVVCTHAAALVLLVVQQTGPPPHAPASKSVTVAFGKSEKNLAEQLLAGVDKHYNSLSTTSMHFEQRYRSNGRERVLTGEVFLKKSGLMRWEYGEPEVKLFVCDGKTVSLYSPSENQVRRAPVKNIDDLRSPIRFLLGKSRLTRELEQAEVPSDFKPLTAGNVVVSGVPKNFGARIEMIWIEIDPDRRIDRLVMLDHDGTETEFRFSGRKENIKIEDSRFRFTPLRGVG